MNIKIFLGRVFSFRNAKTAALALGGIAVFLFAVSYGLSWYEQWKGRQGVENLAKMLKKIEAEDYKLAMADTYGGKTPQETLQMYIDAVEKGDYELASRYMIIPKQEEELSSLKLAPKENIQEVINLLKKAILINIDEGGDNSDYIGRATMKVTFDSGPSMYVNFWKYPGGNWKIQDF